MLYNGDIKGLEIVVAGDLSRDKVISKEVWDKFDYHADNQKVFGLPDRVTAKRFIFKLLYGATAYGFYSDPDFFEVKFNQKQWQAVIDRFYEKYRGIAKWHLDIIEEVKRNRRLEIPSGRYFPYEPLMFHGEMKWPITTIKNYPVQGFGADLVKLARLEANRLLTLAELETLLVSTIHDSLVADGPSRELDEVAKILLQAVENVPALCKRVWGYDFSLPLTAEIQYGPNKHDMVEYKFDNP